MFGDLFSSRIKRHIFTKTRDEFFSVGKSSHCTVRQSIKKRQQLHSVCFCNRIRNQQSIRKTTMKKFCAVTVNREYTHTNVIPFFFFFKVITYNIKFIITTFYIKQTLIKNFNSIFQNSLTEIRNL